MSARSRLTSAGRAVAKDGAAAAVTAALTVRPAGPGDLKPLGFFCDAVLRKDYFLRRGQLADILHNAHHRTYVAEIDAVLVGVAIMTRGTRLVNVLVHPAYRGLGIGRVLIDASGATEVRAKVDMSTGDPRAFYRALGFEGTGERNGKGNIELMRRCNGNGQKGASHAVRTPVRTTQRSEESRKRRVAETGHRGRTAS